MDYNEFKINPDKAIVIDDYAYALLDDDPDVARIKHLLSVKSDFDLAYCACEMYRDGLNSGMGEFQLRVLYDAAVVSYWRPFVDGTQPDGRKGRNIKGLWDNVPADFRARHEQIKPIRNQRIAHRDFRQEDDSQMPQVIGTFKGPEHEFDRVHCNLLDGSDPQHIQTIAILSWNLKTTVSTMIYESMSKLNQKYRSEIADGTFQPPAAIRSLTSDIPTEPPSTQ